MNSVPASEWPPLDRDWLTQSGWKPSDEGWHAVQTEPVRAFGLDQRAFYELPKALVGWTGTREPFVIRAQAGWPARSVIGSIWFEDVVRARPNFARKLRLINAFAIEVPVHLQPERFIWIEHRALPYMPIWPGFALNTIFYAALLWLVTLAPFTTRRMIRRKRDLCFKCGYDLRGTSEIGCPECGWGRETEA